MVDAADLKYLASEIKRDCTARQTLTMVVVSCN